MRREVQETIRKLYIPFLHWINHRELLPVRMRCSHRCCIAGGCTATSCKTQRSLNEGALAVRYAEKRTRSGRPQAFGSWRAPSLRSRHRFLFLLHRGARGAPPARRQPASPYLRREFRTTLWQRKMYKQWSPLPPPRYYLAHIPAVMPV